MGNPQLTSDQMTVSSQDASEFDAWLQHVLLAVPLAVNKVVIFDGSAAKIISGWRTDEESFEWELIVGPKEFVRRLKCQDFGACFSDGCSEIDLVVLSKMSNRTYAVHSFLPVIFQHLRAGGCVSFVETVHFDLGLRLANLLAPEMARYLVSKRLDWEVWIRQLDLLSTSLVDLSDFEAEQHSVSLHPRDIMLSLEYLWKTRSRRKITFEAFARVAS